METLYRVRHRETGMYWNGSGKNSTWSDKHNGYVKTSLSYVGRFFNKPPDMTRFKSYYNENVVVENIEELSEKELSKSTIVLDSVGHWELVQVRVENV